MTDRQAEALEALDMLAGVAHTYELHRDVIVRDLDRISRWNRIVRQALEQQKRIIKSLENTAFRHGAMLDPPCFCCGYEGEGYFQSDTHPCAERHHELYRWRKSPAKPEQDG